MKRYYYSIDVGGTNIKGGIVDESGNVLFRKTIKTLPESQNFLSDSIIKLVKELEKISNLSAQKACGIAVGLPGLIDSQNGVLGFSGNLKLKDYPLKSELEKAFNVQIKIANDADVATLAELHFGAGKNLNNFIMVTVGTGIGGGIVVNRKLLSETVPYAGEIGHMKTTDKKIKCTCGEYGCFEATASTKALVSMTKLAMKKNPQSKMWQTYDLDSADGKTVFEYKDTDETAKEVFDNFISNLGSGLVSLSNIFMPEAIIVSGAISNQGKNISVPLETYINSHIFAKNVGVKIKVKIAEFTGSAGLVGGICLFE